MKKTLSIYEHQALQGKLEWMASPTCLGSRSLLCKRWKVAIFSPCEMHVWHGSNKEDRILKGTVTDSNLAWLSFASKMLFEYAYRDYA